MIGLPENIMADGGKVRKSYLVFLLASGQMRFTFTQIGPDLFLYFSDASVDFSRA